MVVEFEDYTGDWGYTDFEAREVGLRRGLLQRQRLPTLLHEAFHVYYQHQGHQELRVEKRINEDVALILVDAAEYAFWERQLGGCVGGIASALDQPVWIIEAYQRALCRAHVG